MFVNVQNPCNFHKVFRNLNDISAPFFHCSDRVNNLKILKTSEQSIFKKLL